MQNVTLAKKIHPGSFRKVECLRISDEFLLRISISLSFFLSLSLCVNSLCRRNVCINVKPFFRPFGATKQESKALQNTMLPGDGLAPYLGFDVD